MNEPKETTKEGQVAKEVQRQKNLAEELQDITGRIETRLAGVMTESEKPEPTSGDRQSLVQLASQIEGNNNSVQSCITQLISILNRLEL